MIFFSTGTKVEGILRQAADVEEVDRRVQEYEQGIPLIHINYTLFWKLLINYTDKEVLDILFPCLIISSVKCNFL